MEYSWNEYVHAKDIVLKFEEQRELIRQYRHARRYCLCDYEPLTTIWWKRIEINREIQWAANKGKNHKDRELIISYIKYMQTELLIQRKKRFLNFL